MEQDDDGAGRRRRPLLDPYLSTIVEQSASVVSGREEAIRRDKDRLQDAIVELEHLKLVESKLLHERVQVLDKERFVREAVAASDRYKSEVRRNKREYEAKLEEKARLLSAQLGADLDTRLLAYDPPSVEPAVPRPQPLPEPPTRPIFEMNRRQLSPAEPIESPIRKRAIEPVSVDEEQMKPANNAFNAILHWFKDRHAKPEWPKTRSLAIKQQKPAMVREPIRRQSVPTPSDKENRRRIAEERARKSLYARENLGRWISDDDSENTAVNRIAARVAAVKPRPGPGYDQIHARKSPRFLRKTPPQKGTFNSRLREINPISFSSSDDDHELDRRSFCRRRAAKPTAGDVLDRNDVADSFKQRVLARSRLH